MPQHAIYTQMHKRMFLPLSKVLLAATSYISIYHAIALCLRKKLNTNFSGAQRTRVAFSGEEQKRQFNQHRYSALRFGSGFGTDAGDKANEQDGVTNSLSELLVTGEDGDRKRQLFRAHQSLQQSAKA